MAKMALDSRIYCDFPRLVRLQGQSQSLRFLAHMKANTALVGRHSSRFRGRGLNFEELRHYQLGDDIRNLDWKVTIRTGKPHVRTYTEEKDRHVLIALDQRSAMFFSSQHSMKSVVAAEIAALTAWRILKDNDRVGFCLATPDGITHHKASRSQQDLLRELNHIATCNQALNVTSTNQSHVHFSDWLQSIARLKLKSATIIIISDWSDSSEQDIKHLRYLQQHNDVLGLLVSDPMEQSLPDEVVQRRWVIGDGDYQMSLDSQAKLTLANQSLMASDHLKREQLIKMMALHQLPLVELTTDGEHLKQFKRAIGGNI